MFQRWIFRPLVAAVFAFVLGFTLAASFQIPLSQTERQTQTQKEAADKQPKDSILSRFWNWTTHDPVAFYTSVLALFTGILGASTILLWWETKAAGDRQVTDTRTLQRAYISVEPQGIVSVSEEIGDESAIAHIGIRNNGNLPARQVSWIIKWDTDLLRFRESFPVSEEETTGRNVVAPGTMMTQGGDRFALDESLPGGAQGGPFLYIWGAVYYGDGFDDSPRRMTMFCHRYNFENMPSGDAKWFFKADVARIHRYGNDAT